MLEDAPVIADFDDFCLWMYVVIDDLWQHLGPLVGRPGPAPDCSDSELITMTLVGACRGWDVETELVSYWHERRVLFPVVPERSRFNRRRRNLMHAINTLLGLVVQLLDLAQDRYCAIDSLPIPAVQFHLVPGASREWAAHGASFGKVITKKQTIFGYKLHLLITLNGIILDFILAPAHQCGAGPDLGDNEQCGVADDATPEPETRATARGRTSVQCPTANY